MGCGSSIEPEVQQQSPRGRSPRGRGGRYSPGSPTTRVTQGGGDKMSCENVRQFMDSDGEEGGATSAGGSGQIPQTGNEASTSMIDSTGILVVSSLSSKNKLDNVTAWIDKTMAKRPAEGWANPQTMRTPRHAVGTSTNADLGADVGGFQSKVR